MDAQAQSTGAAAQVALEHALAITTAVSEADLAARTVEAAGVLTGATAACTAGPTGSGCTWGRADLASALLAESIRVVPRPVQPCGSTDAFAHLGLPDALTTAEAGTILVVAATDSGALGPESCQLLALVLAHAAAGRERLQELALLARLADRDPLTGLRHYRPFEERLAASLPNRTAVLAVDIDNFKRINDRYGHQAGDAALVALVHALGRALRGDDHIYRIGGDEFAVVIEVATPAEVGGITARLLAAARGVGYPISVGAALRRPTETGRETLLRADRALYQAKRAGRNTARLAA
ncbi:MAG TPA: GGDEF domain-containing protein [Micromonosporaceae bacterium]|jgi:diguanylate cyclase (GGDEF)-like protein